VINMSIQITVVRYDASSARAQLSMYMFDKRYGGPRVPRGIEPELVSDFIQERLEPDSPADAFRRAVEVLRFYERPDALRTMRRALTGHESTAEDVMRSAYALQAIGDLGTPGEVSQAADYFDRVLVPQPQLTAELYSILLDTLLTLAPAGSTTALSQKLNSEVRKLEPGQRSSETAMFAYDKLAAVQRNQLPKITQAIENKKQVAAAPPNPRRGELVRMYLGLSPRGGGSLGVWAARLLRKEAMEGDPAPVYAEFSKAMNAIDEKKLGKDPAKLIFLRGAQAILYLQGELSQEQRMRFEASGTAGMNFLWDDLKVTP
jgi:hypothetical protein